MSTKTPIEWADRTWGPVLGCTKVSSGCDRCYAITTAHIRAGHRNPKIAIPYAGLTTRVDGHTEWTGQVNLVPGRMLDPFSWAKPQRVFVNSQSDLFHTDVPDWFIARVFAVMALTPQHTYQLLTKRHGRMRSLLAGTAFREQVKQAMWKMTDESPAARAAWRAMHNDTGWWPLRNLWLGVSVEDQRTAEMRIPALIDTPASVRWISAEPLLGPIDLNRTDQHTLVDGGLDWIVVGGESGPGARPMHPDWVRRLRDQVTGAGVPFFFKQWGEHLPLAVVDRPDMAHGRAYQYGGWTSVGIREPGPSGTYRNAVSRPMRVGETNRAGTLLDADTFARRVGKKAAGRELDGRTWDEYPSVGGRS